MREPRTAVMILGEAWWQEPGGSVRKISARMEDKSLSGACIRVETRIDVGSLLKGHCRQEQFSGISKYCRSDGKEFLVGIERDKTARELALPAPASVAAQDAKTNPQIVGRPLAGAVSETPIGAASLPAALPSVPEPPGEEGKPSSPSTQATRPDVVVFTARTPERTASERKRVWQDEETYAKQMVRTGKLASQERISRWLSGREQCARGGG